MDVEFKLPEVSEGVEAVDIADVLVAEGDTVATGQVVFEVETDKAAAEIECPHAGTITKVHVSVGSSVPIGATILTIDPGESSDSGDSSSTAASVTAAGSTESESSQSSAISDSDANVTLAPTARAADASVDGGATIEFRLPDVSEGVEAVDVAEVLVTQGDVIEAGQVVCEVETDKAAAEIECPHSGRVRTIHFSVGDSIPIGAILLTLESDTASADAATLPDFAPSAPAAPPSGVSSESASPRPVGSPTENRPAAPAKPPTMHEERPPAPAGPATRRLARRLGVDLRSVNGSGRGGRITQEDVEEFVRSHLAAPDRGATAAVAATMPPLPDFSRFGPIERRPLNRIERTAAERLSAAWAGIPHVTQHDLADVTELEAARKRYVKSNTDSPKVTMTAIMIKAVIGALKEYPRFNASIDIVAGELIVKNYYHIGVAVDTPHGLVVPVIRDCDRKNVLEVAGELADLAIRAREGKLHPDDIHGAAFTITNLGGIGGTAFTPIVNHPQVAILGMSRSRKELRIEDGKVVERLMLPMSLSYDHRAINGADAARFIVRLSSSLSNFFELF